MQNSINLYDVLVSMREYQKENNIKNHCIVNTIFMYDMFKVNTNMNIKAKAMYVLSKKNKFYNVITAGHLLLILDDEKIIDPSYDVFCQNDKKYYNNLKDLMKDLENNELQDLKSQMNEKKLISDHLKFMEIANKINNDTMKIGVDDRSGEHYNKQADYIEKKFSKYLKHK